MKFKSRKDISFISTIYGMILFLIVMLIIVLTDNGIEKGLIIKYDKYSEIYISPKTNDLFIKKILELNSEIKIVTK